MVREAELDGIKDQLTRPNDLKKTITDTVDPGGEISKGLMLDEADAKKLGSVPLKSTTATDMENMTESDPDEAGEAKQFEQPVDDDVMPIPAANKAANKAETKA
jgi:hypothetical protein